MEQDTVSRKEQPREAPVATLRSSLAAHKRRRFRLLDMKRHHCIFSEGRYGAAIRVARQPPLSGGDNAASARQSRPQKPGRPTSRSPSAANGTEPPRRSVRARMRGGGSGSFTAAACASVDIVICLLGGAPRRRQVGRRRCSNAVHMHASFIQSATQPCQEDSHVPSAGRRRGEGWFEADMKRQFRLTSRRPNTARAGRRHES